MDFFVVGAEKCGTTWLADMLRQHPGVFIPDRKEIHYFNRNFDEYPDLDNYNFDKPKNWYYSFFKNAGPEQMKGEVCPAYLWDHAAPFLIYKYFPAAKIIIVLRDPVERAYSGYRFFQQRGLIDWDCSFKAAIDKFHHQLIFRSLYYNQVVTYFDIFDSEQILVMFFDDLKKDNESFLIDIESFLGLEPFIPDDVNQRSNVTKAPRYTWINRMFSYLRYVIRKYELHFVNDIFRTFKFAKLTDIIRRRNVKEVTTSSKKEVNPGFLQHLYNDFSEDVRKLESLLEEDLSHWKEPGSTRIQNGKNGN